MQTSASEGGGFKMQSTPFPEPQRHACMNMSSRHTHTHTQTVVGLPEDAALSEQIVKKTQEHKSSNIQRRSRDSPVSNVSLAHWMEDYLLLSVMIFVSPDLLQLQVIGSIIKCQVLKP